MKKEKAEGDKKRKLGHFSLPQHPLPHPSPSLGICLIRVPTKERPCYFYPLFFIIYRYFLLLLHITAFNNIDHLGSPPKSHSEQMYGPGLTITYKFSSWANLIKALIKNKEQQ